MENESVIIFDEVQLHPKARQSSKYLVADGRYNKHMETEKWSIWIGTICVKAWKRYMFWTKL